MTSVPGGTLTGAPSMVRLTRPSVISRLSSANQYGCAFACEIRLELPADLLDAAHNRSRTRVRQHADRLSGHVFGEIEQQIEIFGLPLPRQNQRSRSAARS